MTTNELGTGRLVSLEEEMANLEEQVHRAHSQLDRITGGHPVEEEYLPTGLAAALRRSSGLMESLDSRLADLADRIGRL